MFRLNAAQCFTPLWREFSRTIIRPLTPTGALRENDGMSNLMTAETATIIQTVAATIQAVAAVVFLFGVAWDARARRHERQHRARLAEQERRDHFVTALRQLWMQSTITTASKTDEELSGFYTQRIIDFINEQLEARGETWSYPFKREE
jgi:hypothetical protein